MGSIYRINCLGAVEKFVGSREELAKRLHIATTTLNHWHVTKQIPQKYILQLVKLSEGKFTATEFLSEEKPEV